MAQYPENESLFVNPDEYLNKSHDFLGSPYQDVRKIPNDPQDNALNKSYDFPEDLFMDDLQDVSKSGHFLDKAIQEDAQKEKELAQKEEMDPLAHYKTNDLNMNSPIKEKAGGSRKEDAESVQEVIRREVPEELTWNEMNTAAREYFRVRKIAYQARKKSGIADEGYDRNAQWSDLSMNQKIKRKKKAVAKQQLRNTAMQFAKDRANAQKQLQEQGADPIIGADPAEAEINAFLGINLESFHLNNDEEFIGNLAGNYRLTDHIEPMEQLLNRVTSGQSVLETERMQEITRQLAFLKEMKEWMDARLALIQDPYYVLISSKELTDSEEVLNGLQTMTEKKYKANAREDQNAIPNVMDFLLRYERVRTCTFDRSRYRSREEADLSYGAQFRRETDRRGDELNRELIRKRKIHKDRAIREDWQKRAEEAVLAEKKAEPLVWYEERPKTELFRQKSKEFLNIDLNQLHFGKVEDILTHHLAHDLLFEQAREMQRILSEVSQEEKRGISDEELISVRARLALFGELRRRQTRTLLELTKKDIAGEEMLLEEWVQTHDLVLNLDPALQEKAYRDLFRSHQEKAEEKIREMYEQLKPGQQILGTDEKDHFQRNLLFWESMKAARMELSAQDDETEAFLNSYYRNLNREVPEISRHLRIHLRGKSTADKKAILRRYDGTPEERMQLEKEMANQALNEAKRLEEFRVNPDNPATFLRNVAYKLHVSEMLVSAKEAAEQIDRIHNENPNNPVPEGYTEEYRKELMALSEFAGDHIAKRMKVMTDVAGHVDSSFLGAVNIREFRDIVGDRHAIKIDLEAPVGEEQTAARTAAKVMFETADTLFRKMGEQQGLDQKKKQTEASADASLDPVYQTYRLAYGIQEKRNEQDAVRRKALGSIEEIGENPLYRSREELQTLRDRCITALSEYEKEVPEYLYYHLSTSALKELAVRKLRDNLDSDTIKREVQRYQAAGLHVEEEDQQPEWGEKEKNAILLMGNLAGMEEKKEEDGEDLLSLLSDHAEIIADMARVAMSDEKKKKSDRKRYRELKQKIEDGENLDAMLQEEESALREMQERYEKASKEENEIQERYEKASKEEKPDKEHVEHLNSQVVMYQKQVKSLRERKEDWEKNQAAYRKELDGLSYLDAPQKPQAPDEPQNVFDSMGRRLEGLDGSIAREVGAGLSGVVNFLVQKAGGSVLSLRSVRSLLQKKDPVLMKLLKEAKSRIKTSMDRLYKDVCQEIREVTPFMFENLNEDTPNLMEGFYIHESGADALRKAYHQKKYEEADMKEDQEQTRQIEEKAEEALKDLETRKKEMDQEAFNQRKKEIEMTRDQQLAFLGPDGRFLKQSADLVKVEYHAPTKEKETTLEMLHNQNWAYDEKILEQPGEGTFVRNVMRNYFEKADEKDKRAMLQTMFFSLKPMIRDHKHIKVNSLKQTGMHLAGMLRGAGPLMQKLMQGVPQRYLMTELCEAVEDMKSNLAPIPDSYVKKVFEQMKKDSKGKIKEIKKLQSLGAASVGQTFLCRIEGEGYPGGMQVVIKILRPNVSERIDREEKIMKDCAKATSAGMLVTYEGQLTKVREELDLTKEAKNIREGIQVYEKEEKGVPGVCRSVHVMDVIPSTQQYLVLDKAEGDTFDRFLSKIAKDRTQSRKPFQRIMVDPYSGERQIRGELELTSENVTKFPEIRQSLVKDLISVTERRVHLEKVTDQWIRESIMGTGFYHGDMHAGNLMATDKEATILDYGNATKLTDTEVKRVLELYASAMYGDARFFLDCFLKCLPEDQQKKLDGKDSKDPEEAFQKTREFTMLKNKLRKKLFRIFRRGQDSQTGDKVELALTELQKYGFQVPISLYSFVQSQIRLNNTLRDLNDQETGLRNDIKRLDAMRPRTEESYVNVNLLIQAHMGAVTSGSLNQEGYYTGLLHALKEPDEAEFLTLIADKTKDKDGKTAFEKKYMGIFDKVNLIMSGKATCHYRDMMTEKEMTKSIPKPEINVDEWRKEYEEYLQLLKADQEQTALEKKGKAPGAKIGESEIHTRWKIASKALQNKLSAVFMLPDTSQPTGLLEDFGNHFVFMGMVGGAISGDRDDFNEFVDFIENHVLPLIALSADLREYIDKGRKKDAKDLFRRYKNMMDTIAERHKVISDVRTDICYDRYGLVQKLSNDDMGSLKIQEFDTTQFREIYPEWKKLYDRKNGLQPEAEPFLPEEEEKMNSMWEDLRECRRVGMRQKGLRDRLNYISDQMAPWFSDQEDGNALADAYHKLCDAREKDMANRDRKWNDNTALSGRIQAERNFLRIYRRIGYKHMKEHMNAFTRKVPPQKDEIMKDFNLIFEDMVKKNGLSLIPKVEFNTLTKVNAYLSGKYVGGLDLEDTIPEKPGETAKTITRKTSWSLEEEEREEALEREALEKEKKDLEEKAAKEREKAKGKQEKKDKIEMKKEKEEQEEKDKIEMEKKEEMKEIMEEERRIGIHEDSHGHT